jgi:ATP-dependent Clp protease ATP-binding subunit ClpA
VLDTLLGGKQFRGEVRGLLLQAQDEAAARGAPTVEAEHLLLAMTTVPFGSASRILEDLRLSHDRVAGALDRERARALALVGVDTRRLPRPRPIHDIRRIGWGQSARSAAERSTGEAHADPQLRMLLGIVRAEVGVIPRLLAELGLTRGDVEDAVRAR